MNYSIVYIIESTMPSALIGACRIRVCNISSRFSSSNDAEARVGLECVI